MKFKRLVMDRRLTGLNSIVVLSTLGLFAELFGNGFNSVVKILILIVALGISVVVFVVDYQRPLISSTEEARKELIEGFLLPMLCVEVKELVPDKSNAILRINIMPMKKTLFVPKGLSIKYAFGAYSDSERSMVWQLEEGCCGFAYSEKRQLSYDRVTNHEMQAKMTDLQKQTTTGVHCVLSTPIFRSPDRANNDPIGVLNIDSSQPIGETPLMNTEVWLRIEQFANAAGTLL